VLEDFQTVSGRVILRSSLPSGWESSHKNALAHGLNHPALIAFRYPALIVGNWGRAPSTSLKSSRTGHFRI
jgi:hypothetical protein